MIFQVQKTKVKMKVNKKEKTFSRGKERALYILERSDKTESELRIKLRQNDYKDEIIDEILRFLREYDYINDSRYAYKYTRYKSKSRSHKQIRLELLKKGVPSDIIKEIFDTDQRSEIETIKYLIKKRKTDCCNMEDKERYALINYLMRKGFIYDQILESIHDLQSELSGQ